MVSSATKNFKCRQNGQINDDDKKDEDMMLTDIHLNRRTPHKQTTSPLEDMRESSLKSTKYFGRLALDNNYVGGTATDINYANQAKRKLWLVQLGTATTTMVNRHKKIDNTKHGAKEQCTVYGTYRVRKQNK